MQEEKERFVRRRGIYLLPNLLTTAGLFAGFYAIVAGMKGHFDSAAIAIFIAMIADMLDGRVARLVHASTDFGVQYDSLADMVSFGIAPALVLYSWALKDLGKFGWLVAFLYAACVALRLARFNVQAENKDKRFFIGLPSPPAAGVVASMVWCFYSYYFQNKYAAIIIAIAALVMALLMVSNVLYRSFKEISFKGRTSFVSLIVIILIFIAVSLDPPLVLFLCFSAYALSGPVLAMGRMYSKSKNRTKKHVSK